MGRDGSRRGRRVARLPNRPYVEGVLPPLLCKLLGLHRVSQVLLRRSDGRVLSVARCERCGAA